MGATLLATLLPQQQHCSHLCGRMITSYSTAGWHAAANALRIHAGLRPSKSVEVEISRAKPQQADFGDYATVRGGLRNLDFPWSLQSSVPENAPARTECIWTRRSTRSSNGPGSLPK